MEWAGGLDNPSEMARIAAAVGPGGRQKVMVRVVPGVSAGGHDKIRTGTEDQKFGLSLTDGGAQHTITRILGQPRLELTGLHCHIGSQITEVKPYLVALRRMIGLMARVRDAHGVVLPELDMGGGHAVAYRPGEAALDLTSLARRLRTELVDGCAAAGLPVPRLAVEPGRAVVGPAGVALYQVLTVKHTGEKVFVAVDGGMSDNPRPALYGVRYAPRLVGRHSAAGPRTATVVGRHCEAGDVLASDVRLPGDVRPGDLLAVPVAGACRLSMASGYNLVGRPAVVAVHEGTARLLVRRETLDDYRSRDIGI
ncbi:Diaminopimelate decarboxylase (plasmid) [Streptomyces sp. ADI95-16]|nr:Diaminopimelate decarboxylase [Streptomyces sp. ADI95-16]